MGFPVLHFSHKINGCSDRVNSVRFSSIGTIIRDTPTCVQPEGTEINLATDSETACGAQKNITRVFQTALLHYIKTLVVKRCSHNRYKHAEEGRRHFLKLISDAKGKNNWMNVNNAKINHGLAWQASKFDVAKSLS